MTKKVINPFDLLGNGITSESSDALASTSSVVNEKHGVCPKCHAPMDTKTVPATASMKSNEAVFWCGNCCVAAPKPL